MTAVETSPDLSHARVYVSVLGDDEEREADARGADATRAASCRRAMAQELRMKRTPTLEFLHDESIDRGFRISRAARGRTSRVSVGTELDQVVEELRAADKLLLTTHENPDGDALGSLLGHALDPRAARQGLGDVHVAGRVPAALRVPRT